MSQKMLWISPERKESLRKYFIAEHKTLQIIFERAKKIASVPCSQVLNEEDLPGGGSIKSLWVTSIVVCHVLEPQSSPLCIQEVLNFFDSQIISTDNELGMANLALQMAILIQSIWSDIDEAERIILFRLAQEIMRRLTQVNKGNPHHVTNNWWAVSHSGLLSLTLSMSDLWGSNEERAEIEQLKLWSRGRVLAFCHHFGPAGLYHEGLGYQGYTCSNLFPALLALMSQGEDILGRYPQFATTASALALASIPKWHVPDAQGDQCFGTKLSWNDDGGGALNVGAIPCAIALAAPEKQAALGWWFEQMQGPQFEGNFCSGFSGWYFVLAYLPLEMQQMNPAGALPLAVTDGRQGLHLIRDRYKDSDDTVLGVYSRSSHVGGHSQDDAASIRFSSLGHDWIIGGGQARSLAQYQSIPVRSSAQRPKLHAKAALIWDELTPQGSLIGLDHRQACGCYAERYVAFHRHHRVLSVLDLIDDHLGEEWDWNLSFNHELTLKIMAENRGFELLAEDGTNMVTHFLADLPQDIRLNKMPDSERTYASGARVLYRGRQYLSCRFKAKPHLGIWTVSTVQRGYAPEIKAKQMSLVFNHEPWEPFLSAVPSGFRPGVDACLCPLPFSHE